MSLNGFFNIYKESGVMSTYVVSRIKKLLKGTPCGHMGTLDPLAEGVLPIGVGKASRLFQFLLEKQKIYFAEFKFGIETDTLDITGKITNEDDKIILESDILKHLDKFKGEISQVPPKFSAVNINGKRCYDLARRGIEFEIQPKKIIINNIELLEKTNENTYKFKIDCGGGTYIRSIARDLAFEMNTYGVMTSLVRAKSGYFDIENAIKLEDLVDNFEDKLILPNKVVDFPEIFLDDMDSTHLLNGINVKMDREDGLYRVYGKDEFFGIGEIIDNFLKMKSYLR